MSAEDFFVEEVLQLEESPGDYLYVRVTKQNWNTLDVVRALARILRVPRNTIGFAGTKDRNATTTQYFSVYKGDPNRVKNMHLTGVAFEPLFFGKRPIVLGMLYGNKFQIKKAFARVDVPRTMINYFGPQRFSANNAAIGKAIIQKEWKTACALIQQREVHEALAEHPTNYVGALQRLDKRLLSLYLSAFQAQLWNQVVARCVRASGKDTFVKEGLVFVKEADDARTVPLLAFDTVFADPEIETAYRELLRSEGVALSDFVVRALPDILPVSVERPFCIPVKDFAYEKGWLSFFLPKGSYATVLVLQLESFL